MPNAPKLVVDTMVRLFGRPIEVTHTSEPAPRVKRVRFQGPTLVGIEPAPHDHIELRVGPTSMRHYSLAAHDRAAGTMDVIFFLHGDGPGSAWARGLEVGATTRLLGPSAGRRFRIDPSASRHLLLGDETCIGMAEWMSTSLSPFRACLEVDEDSEPAARAVAGAEVVRRHTRGDALVRWLEGNPPGLSEAVYLAGHAQTIGRLKRVLRARSVPSHRIRVEPYWADGKRGL